MSKYIKEITVKVGDVEHNLRFSMIFWSNLCSVSGLTIDGLEELLTGDDPMDQIESFATIMLSAKMAYDQKHGNKIDYTIYDILEWFDEDLDDEEFNKVTDALQSTRLLSNPSNHGLKRNSEGNEEAH